MARFFKFTEEDLELTKSFTAGEWRLFAYLRLIDPFGEKYHDIDTFTVLAECDIKKTTFYKAIAKFQDLGLFDFQDKGFSFRHLGGEFDRNQDFPKKRKTFRENGIDSEKTENQFGKTENTIYIELQTDQTLSEAREKIERSFEKEATEPLTPITEIKIQSSVNPVIGSEDKYSARCTTQSVQERSFSWLPQGPWNLEGKLDPNFRDWLAGKWMSEYGKDIHTQRANVLSHFKKDPANLPIRWEQYQGEYLDRIQNTQILLNNGLEIPSEYQERLIANQRAITAELPQELNPVAVLPEIKPAAIAVIAPSPELSLSKISALPQNDDYVRNEDGHKLKVFRASDSEISPEEAAKNREWLFQALKGALGGKKAEPKPQITELEELNNWITDPVLRSEAMKRVMASDRYQCLFDEEGTPYQVIEQPQSKPQTKLPDDYEYDF